MSKIVWIWVDRIFRKRIFYMVTNKCFNKVVIVSTAPTLFSILGGYDMSSSAFLWKLLNILVFDSNFWLLVHRIVFSTHELCSYIYFWFYCSQEIIFHKFRATFACKIILIIKCCRNLLSSFLWKRIRAICSLIVFHSLINKKSSYPNELHFIWTKYRQ